MDVAFHVRQKAYIAPRRRHGDTHSHIFRALPPRYGQRIPSNLESVLETGRVVLTR